MGRYERVDEHGQVVERVHVLNGTYEDTRLGVAALEETGGWRVAEPPGSAEPGGTPE
ncbi:hypothetical protein ACBI99_44705 [Nonomuraea sp. ATR24]|uniref:hypothetical protein n=1 Tax=Nonomuraea sp. ATR24 TaxID=1676744 RepID=UPI0035C055E2